MRVWCWGGCLVNYIGLIAVSSERAFVSLGGLAVAFLVLGSFSLSLLENLSVVGINNLFDVSGATVRNFGSVFVEDRIESVVLREVFPYQIQKHPA